MEGRAVSRTLLLQLFDRQRSFRQTLLNLCVRPRRKPKEARRTQLRLEAEDIKRPGPDSGLVTTPHDGR